MEHEEGGAFESGKLQLPDRRSRCHSSSLFPSYTVQGTFSCFHLPMSFIGSLAIAEEDRQDRGMEDGTRGPRSASRLTVHPCERGTGRTPRTVDAWLRASLFPTRRFRRMASRATDTSFFATAVQQRQYGPPPASRDPLSQCCFANPWQNPEAARRSGRWRPKGLVDGLTRDKSDSDASKTRALSPISLLRFPPRLVRQRDFSEAGRV